MDKKKIETLCQQIIRAANQVEHKGEENSAQLLGICGAAREMLIELGKPEKEANDG